MFKTGKDVGTKVERLESMVGKDLRPDGVFGIWAMRDNPEALVWVMDEGNDFALGVSDRPSTAKEVEGVVRVETALDVESQVEVQQRSWRNG
jgi:hypothetical protein